MKRHLAILAGSLTLGLGCLAVIVSARTMPASAPPRVAKEADGAPRLAASRITHVTIYPDSALVTREVEVPPGSGLLELVIGSLPEATMASSLYTEPSDGIRVLTTRFRTRPVKEDTREEVRKLEEEIKRLQQESRRLQAEVQAITANTQLMTKLEAFTTASTVHATEKGKLDSEAAIALAKYLMDGRLEKMKQQVTVQEQIEKNTEALTFAQRQLSQLTTGTSKVERDAVIVVDKGQNGGGKVRLNYLVSAAAWRPQYKLRAGKTTKDPVTLEYLAAVVQQTGEDWERVNVTLSTAQPMLNAAPPTLHALAVAVVPRGAPIPGVTLSGLQTGLNLGGQFGGQLGGMPGAGGGAFMGGPGGSGMPGGVPMQQMAQPTLPSSRLALANPEGKASVEELNAAADNLRKQAQELSNRTNNEKDASELANYAAVLEQARDLVLVQKKAKAGAATARPGRNEGPSVTYHLPTRLSVPSRTDDQVIEVARIELPPDYYYKAVPVLTPHVYRQAALTNKSKFVLLPGEATMYHDTDFVGRMTLPLVAIGEEFTVGFGTEPQLQVQRQLLERTRTMQGGNQILTYQYRILVSSYKDEKVKLQVWDRLPHGENEAMGITLVKTTPELSKDSIYTREERPNNLLRWDVDVDLDMRGEKAHKIDYDFKLELDKQATLGSFQSR